MSDMDLLNLTSANGFKISGAFAGDWTGSSVSNAGDINGDGIADLVIGAYGPNFNELTKSENWHLKPIIPEPQTQ